MKKIIFFKTMMVAVMLVIGSMSAAWGADIIPKLYLTAQNTPSGNTGWTIINATANNAGTDYWKMINTNAVIVSAAMNLNDFTAETCVLKLGTFGTVSAAKQTITVYISIDNGVSWSASIATRIPTINSSTAMAAIDLSSYSGTQVRLKFANLGGDASIGVRFFEAYITGTSQVSASPVVTAASPTGTYNTAFFYNIVASNSPTGYAIATGTLPAGLTLNTTTGAITGTPTTTGSSLVDVTATNGTGTSVAATLSFTIAKANQTITFGVLTDKTQNVTADYSPGATSATSGVNPITYTSSLETVATIVTGNIHIVSVGTTNITASQAGDANYNGATPVIQSLTVVAPITTPTVTVTESSVPAMVAVVGSTNTQTINVSGINLTAAISMNVSGADAGLFTLSQASVPQTSGTAANTVITITYTPTAAGSHSATFTLSSAGATNVTRSLTGTATWAPLSTPVVNTPQTTESSIAANWDVVVGATEYQLDMYTKTGGGANATDLFISEYVEGSSNNKYIEIYNGTGATVDLTDYKLRLYANGTSTPSNDVALTGTLLNGNVVVYKSSSATVYTGTSEINATCNFNGDDAIALYKVSTSSDVDIFGGIGVDPGTSWGTTPLITLDKTLVRKSSVTGGVTSNPASGFPTLSTEWDSYATDVVSNLGSHTMAGGGSTSIPVSGSPFTVSGGSTTSYQVNSLTKFEKYYYTVTAKNANVTSSASIEVVASPGTTANSFVNSNLQTQVIARNGKIILNAVAGVTLEIYNATGQKLLQKQLVEGMNSIPVSVRGVVLVKVGNKMAKVIL